MKALIISVILFVLLIACIISNVGYIHTCADRLEILAGAMETPTDEELAALEAFWDKNEGLIGLSVSSVHLDSISKTIVSIRSAYEVGNKEELLKQCALLSDSANDVRRLEQLAIENIF